MVKGCCGNTVVGVYEERQGLVYFREISIEEVVIRNLVISIFVKDILS